MTDNQRASVELDEILSRAVDRQIAEQRALRQTLDELRDSVRELSGRPAARVDLTPIEERIDKISRTVERSAQEPLDLSGLEERIRGAISASVSGASETTFSSLSDQLRSLREVVVPRLEHAAETNATVRTIAEDMGAVREAVGGVSTDLEGVAQALLDFNTGLRGWASGVDETISSIKLTVGELYALSTQPARPGDETRETKELEKEAEEEEEKKPAEKGKKATEAEAGEPPPGIEDRIKETAELSEYLADQIEDLDGLMGRLTELPQQLEGVVSQALKRTLTARAKLDREAETALDDVLEALDEHVNQLAEVLQRFEHEEDHMRKMALEQVELSSRIESLQSTFIDRIERIETQRRRGEEAIAVAIDRTARGLAPRALESLSKSTKRKVTAPAPRKAKAKASAKTKAVAKTTARKQPKPKPKRSRSRRANRLDWTPLPSDEAPR
jgi:hypothetical protein